MKTEYSIGKGRMFGRGLVKYIIFKWLNSILSTQQSIFFFVEASTAINSLNKFVLQNFDLCFFSVKSK